MDKAIKKIRTKFIVMAMGISVTIISIMVIVLNLLMNINYENENRMVVDMISKTALVSVSTINTEKYYFKDIPRNLNGDYELSNVNINNVDSIILYGNITSKDTNLSWYCGGGGLMFYFQQANGENILVHKEYVFNKDNSSVTIDFSNYDDVMYNSKYIELKNGKIIGDGLIVSPTWWTSSSHGVQDDNVSIALNSIEIVYKSNVQIQYSNNYSIKKQDFSNIFGDEAPIALNGLSSFYLITDKDYNLLEVNYGNLLSKPSDDKVLEYIQTVKSKGKSGTILLNEEIPYNYTIKSDNNVNVITFYYNVIQNVTLRRLILISILVGLVLIIILFILIMVVSKNTIKPLALALEKQKEFISNASHELKTPITVISATTDLLKNQVGENRWITCIKQQSEKMEYLVKELLSLARISEMQSNSKIFNYFDISQAVSNAILYFECRAYEENKTIHSNIQEDIQYLGDQNKIVELVNILMDNALKYSMPDTQIDFSLTLIKNKIVMECSNYCEDTTNFDVTRIFERFYRNDKSHSNEKEGFGLGLSIAQSIVEYHNGTIKAKKSSNTINFVVTLSK